MRTLWTIPVLLCVLSAMSCQEGLELEEVSTSREEAVELERIINEHRVERGLAPISSSPALRAVARAHVADLELHDPREPCNLHSWSEAGTWTACCYQSNNPIVECMVNKPVELTGYPGPGYEIAVARHGVFPLDHRFALKQWKNSPAHHEVIVNRGPWQNQHWNAMGAAITSHYAVVWFSTGPEEDDDDD